MATIVFNEGFRLVNSGGILLSTDTIKIMLVNASVTPTGDETTLSPFTSAEISVTNYTSGYANTGRKTLASGNMSYTKDDANNYVYFDHTVDPVWTALGAGATIRAGIIYKHTGGSDGTSIPIVYVQLASDIPTNGGDFTFQFNSSGIYRAALI